MSRYGTHPKVYSPETIEKAVHLWAFYCRGGSSKYGAAVRTAASMSLAIDTVRSWTDPDYRERKLSYKRNKRTTNDPHPSN